MKSRSKLKSLVQVFTYSPMILSSSILLNTEMKHFLHAIKTGLGITPFVTEIKDKKQTVNFKGSVQLGKCLCMIVNTSSQDEDY